MEVIKKKISQYNFMFTELVKRDFNKRYKRSILGILWSMIAPMFQLVVMSFVFDRVFGEKMQYYTVYMFAGQLMFNYFREATDNGMQSIIANAGIITKVNAPKYLFLISKVMHIIRFLLLGNLY